MSLLISGVQMVALLVPVLISYFPTGDSSTQQTKQARALHDHVLQRLMKIGPQYPNAFKSVMAASPDLKTKLESAIHANAASKKAKQSRQPSRSKAPAAPSIKLKMNFSNFTG